MPTVVASEVERSVLLYQTAGSADKRYNIYLVRSGDQWIARSENGKRHGPLGPQKLMDAPGTYAEALKAFEAKLKAQVKKGYTTDISGIPGTPCVFDTPGVAVQAPDMTGVRDHSGMPPVQLLVLIEDRATLDRKLAEPGWIWQVKADGERRPIRKDGDQIVAGNRVGLITPLHPAAAAKIRALPYDQIELDCEDLGDGNLVAFDVMSINGTDLRARGYASRYETLAALFHGQRPNAFSLPKTACTPAEARTLFATIEAQELEGIVGKRADAPYTAGRGTPTNAPQIKFVLRRIDSFVVLKPVKNKRSVEIGVYEADGTLRSVGNLTVPANRAMPEVGTVVDVSYRFAYPQGGLCMPIFNKTRNDIPVTDCQASRLKMQRVGGADSVDDESVGEAAEYPATADTDDNDEDAPRGPRP